MSRLALTMIVRNEAGALPDFLAHHAPLFDELVVVDTGSDDGTREILAAAGGTVVERPWADDFASARNVGLDHVTADWVLLLDADERISQTDFPALRGLLGGPPNRVFLQETWNYCRGLTHLEWQPLPGRYPAEEAGQTGLFVARRIGVFPRHADLRFQGRVHESILPAATGAGMQVVPLDIPVHHYGYVATAARNEARQARYRKLVAAKLADEPRDPAAQLEMATVLLEDGEPTAASEVLAALVTGPAGLRPVVRGLVLLGRLRREMGELRQARELLAQACEQDPDFVFGWLERIRVEAAAAAWLAAETLLKEAGGRFGRQNPLLLREALRIQVHRRQLGAALASADKLVSYCPQWQEIQDLRRRLQHLIESPRGASEPL